MQHGPQYIDGERFPKPPLPFLSARRQLTLGHETKMGERGYEDNGLGKEIKQTLWSIKIILGMQEPAFNLEIFSIGGKTGCGIM